MCRKRTAGKQNKYDDSEVINFVAREVAIRLGKKGKNLRCEVRKEKRVTWPNDSGKHFTNLLDV